MESETNSKTPIQSVLSLIIIFSIYGLSLSNLFYFAAFSKLLAVIIVCLFIILNPKLLSIPTDYFYKYLIIFAFIFPYIFIQILFHQSYEGDFSLRVGLAFFMIPLSFLIMDHRSHMLIGLIGYVLPLTCIYALIDNNGSYIQPAGNANSLGIIISIGVLVSIYQLMNIQKLALRLFYSASLLLSFYLLYEIFSLGAFLILIVGGSSFLLIQIEKLQDVFKKIQYWHLFLIILVGAIILSVVPYFLYESLSINLIQNLEFRVRLLEAGWKMSADYYLFGTGSGKMNSVIPFYWNPDTTILRGAGESVRHLHNEYLNLFVEGGLFVLLGFLNLIAYAIYNGFKIILNKEDKNQKFIQLVFCLFIGLCIQISFSRSLHFPTVAMIFILLMSILIFSPHLSERVNEGIKSKIVVYFSCAGVFIFLMPLLFEGYQLHNIHDDFDKRVKYIELNKALIKNKNKMEVNKQFKNFIAKNEKNKYSKQMKELLIGTNELSKKEEIDFLLYASDAKYDFDNRLRELSVSSRFSDLKYATYRDYLKVLIDYENWDDAFLVAKELFLISPSNLLPTKIIYYYHIDKKEYVKGFKALENTNKIKRNPWLLKTIIEHKINYSKVPVEQSEILECIELRKKIEFDSRFAKYQIDARFGSLKNYYCDLLLLLIKNDLKKEALNLYQNWKKNKDEPYPKGEISIIIEKNPTIFKPNQE